MISNDRELQPWMTTPRKWKFHSIFWDEIVSNDGFFKGFTPRVSIVAKFRLNSSSTFSGQSYQRLISTKRWHQWTQSSGVKPVKNFTQSLPKKFYLSFIYLKNSSFRPPLRVLLADDEHIRLEKYEDSIKIKPKIPKVNPGRRWNHKTSKTFTPGIRLHYL
jgi:hypothetical protein